LAERLRFPTDRALTAYRWFSPPADGTAPLVAMTDGESIVLLEPEGDGSVYTANTLKSDEARADLAGVFRRYLPEPLRQLPIRWARENGISVVIQTPLEVAAGAKLQGVIRPWKRSAGLEEDEKANAELERVIRQARGPIQEVVLAGRGVAVFVDPFLTQAPAAEIESVDRILDGLNRYPVIDAKPLDPTLMKRYESDGFWVIQLKLEPKSHPAEESYDTVYVRLPEGSDRLPFASELPLLITQAVARLQEADAKRPTDGKPLILLMDLPVPAALDVDEASRKGRILKALHDSFA